MLIILVYFLPVFCSNRSFPFCGNHCLSEYYFLSFYTIVMNQHFKWLNNTRWVDSHIVIFITIHFQLDFSFYSFTIIKNTGINILKYILSIKTLQSGIIGQKGRIIKWLLIYILLNCFLKEQYNASPCKYKYCMHVREHT